MPESLRAAVLYEYDSGGAILFTENEDLVLATPQERHRYKPWPELRVVYNEGTPNSVGITNETMDAAESVGLPRGFREWPKKEHRILHGGLVYTFLGFYVPEHLTWFVLGKPDDQLSLIPPP